MKTWASLPKENIETIGKPTMGQSEDEHRFEYRKCLITVSKAQVIELENSRTGSC